MRHTLLILTLLVLLPSYAKAQEDTTFVAAVQQHVDESTTAIKLKETELMSVARAGDMTPERKATCDSIYHIYAAMYEELITYLRQQVTEHHDSPATARLLVQYKQRLGLDFIADFMKTYPHAAADELAPLRDELAIEAKKQPGAELIDFQLPDEVELNHSLSEYIGHGHYVLVDFWASWCGPCRQEMPNVREAYERYHDRGFDILGLSFDQNREAWLRAVADLGMTWPQLSDLQGWKSLAAKQYNVRAIPFTLLFDPEGKVVAANLRGEALQNKLAELLPEQP